jgi:hypothetical protein
MKSLLVKSVILLLSVLAFGCSSISELTQDGIGQPISTVIKDLGPPSRVTPDGKGGSVYIWEQWFDRSYGMRDVWSTMYWVDSKGIIYKWR